MFALVQWSAWCVDTTHHAVHKVIKRMGGQTLKARGVRGVDGVCNFLIAKNAPKSSPHIKWPNGIQTTNES